MQQLMSRLLLHSTKNNSQRQQAGTPLLASVPARTSKDKSRRLPFGSSVGIKGSGEVGVQLIDIRDMTAHTALHICRHRATILWSFISTFKLDFRHVPLVRTCCLRLAEDDASSAQSTLPMTHSPSLNEKYLTHSLLSQASTQMHLLTAHSPALWWECSSMCRVVMAFGGLFAPQTVHILPQCSFFFFLFFTVATA